MNPKQKKIVFRKGALAIVALVAFFAAACASVDPTPIRETIGNAELTIDKAEGSGARQHAALNLQRAKEKLNEARTEFEDENYTRAEYLSEEALIEARLALAKSETAITNNTVEELRSSISQLRQEIERNRSEQDQTYQNNVSQ